MSQNANPRMYVVFAPPPDGWRGNVADLFNLLGNNAQISVPIGFLIGSDGQSRPPDDSGPWLKNGLEWWVWDAGLGDYRPIDQTANIGEILYFGTPPDASHWLQCNGAAYPRAAPYDNLYAVIGNTFGNGDGHSTYNMPTLPDIVDTGGGAVHCHAYIRYT